MKQVFKKTQALQGIYHLKISISSTPMEINVLTTLLLQRSRKKEKICQKDVNNYVPPHIETILIAPTNSIVQTKSDQWKIEQLLATDENDGWQDFTY